MPQNDRWLRLIAAVLFLAFGAYAAAFILEKGNDGTVTEKLHYASLSESFSVKGKAWRELTPIGADGSDYIILAAEGEYLSGGSAVAVKEECAEDYFAYCDYELSKKSYASEEAAVEAIKSGDAAERALAVMYLEGSKAPEKALCPDGVICAPCAGIFTQTGNGIGAVADRANWYFSFESEKAGKLSTGQKLKLKTSPESETEAEVYGIDKNKVTLIVRNGNSFPGQEDCDAKICVSDCRGIKVPRKAMYFDAEGNAFVYVLSAGIREKTAAKIIYKSGNFYLCDDSSLREGMEIIVSGN